MKAGLSFSRKGDFAGGGPAPALNESMSFGPKLKRLMEERGISKQALAKSLGISQQAVGQWLRGGTRPLGRRLDDIAGALAVRPADLLSDEIVESLPAMVEDTSTHGPDDVIVGYGQRLQLARIALGHTKLQFAKLLHVSAAEYGKLERGETLPGLTMLARLKRSFRIGADWVLFGDYSGLDGGIVQKIIDLGADPDSPEPARELRDAFRTAEPPSNPRGFHSSSNGPPRRTIRS